VKRRGIVRLFTHQCDYITFNRFMQKNEFMTSIKHTLTLLLICTLTFSLFSTSLHAQKKQKNKADTEEKAEKPKHRLDTLGLSGLKFRCVGPALTSGRISDLAVHPDNPFVYYVATSSGGVWKTENNGTTYSPIFDSQGSYSIGCITMDPHNPNVIWVGTGENNNQRSVAYGDGIYKSADGGKTWKHMGLKESEHIGRIIVDPRDPNIIYVAAIGPLWSKGGDRGLYKSTDGGESWNATLTVDEHTGVNDVVQDPANPDILYASTFQRRRHVFTYLGGGPGSNLYKSVDGGETWQKANSGLPGVDIGRIGLAISPANPEMIYAIVEAAQGEGGFFRSTNQGASWEKRSGFKTSGNYYQEIIADPKDEHTIYAMDTWMKVSKDGGKTFKNVGEDTKHVDNHCMWINPMNTDHWLVGCDGGLYETFDAAKTWNFKPNLPVTQFYKVAVDNATPFYNIYGGTQDNFSLGGPARTQTAHGITNADWFITHGGDGFESQVDPENPNIVYAQSQYGVLVRYDRQSGEELGIQPKERDGEDQYRWNWDAPLAVSEHKSGRLYFAANKVFRSDDRGNSWEVISDDLTRQLNRNELEVMDRVWSFESVMKNQSTSPYGTIVALSESPIDENLIYIGTDDGLIQVTENGGQAWRQQATFPGIPERTYVNALFASQHDANTVYAAFNNHKNGDFKPYLLKSTDKGNSWTSISANLPERGSVYSLAEDHEDTNLLFCGTEFGVFFTNDGGKHWKQLKAGVPTIAVRDIAIQERENDLVLGTFGRGFYVLDDYRALRNLEEDQLAKEGFLMPTRAALSFEQAMPLGLPGKSFQGDSYYTAENLGPVAMITYYLKDKFNTQKDERRKREKEALKEGKDTPYPSYDDLKSENEEQKPMLLFTILTKQGDVVQQIEKTPSKGINRITWDLRYASTDPINLSPPGFYNPFAGKQEGTLVAPGIYTIVMSKQVGGEIIELDRSDMRVKALDNKTLPAENDAELQAFRDEVYELSRVIQGTQRKLGSLRNELKYMKAAAQKAQQPYSAFASDIQTIEKEMRATNEQLNGDPLKARLDIGQPPSISSRIGWISYEMKYATATPTQTHRNSFAIAKRDFPAVLDEVKALAKKVDALQKRLEAAGAPYTPGRDIEYGGE
jgi:photosystem II stability/assembly factor-like uncharacterized protein